MKLKGRGSWHSKQGKEAIHPIRYASSSRFQNPESRNHSKSHSPDSGRNGRLIPVPVPVPGSLLGPISEFLQGIIWKISENLSDKNESLKISDFKFIQISNHESDLKSVKKKKKKREGEREQQQQSSRVASSFQLYR